MNALNWFFGCSFMSYSSIVFFDDYPQYMFTVLGDSLVSMQTNQGDILNTSKITFT